MASEHPLWVGPLLWLKCDGLAKKIEVDLTGHDDLGTSPIRAGREDDVRNATQKASA